MNQEEGEENNNHHNNNRISSKFCILKKSHDEIKVRDHWGSIFRIICLPHKGKDKRGLQKNLVMTSNSSSSSSRSSNDDGIDDRTDNIETLGDGIHDIMFYTPTNANIEGIARFYDFVLDTPVLMVNESQCVISMGPYQTLTFRRHPNDTSYDTNMHVEMRDEPKNNPEDKKYYPSNYGPHISLYVKDIRKTFQRAEDLGITYVNPRFKRRAYTETEVVKDCMFRCLDIIDPENISDGVILRLEHEVRSVLKEDGGIYKSCPFDEIPEGCVI